jgi:hypothetical protein
MKIIRWKLLDAYKQQTAKDNERSQRFIDRVTEATDQLTVANAKREMLLRREGLEGVNLSEELAAARKEMAVAQEELKMAREDSERVRQIIHEANATDASRINRLQLARDWRNVYKPMVEAEQLEPIKQLAAMGRAMTLNAIVQYYELKNGVEGCYAADHENLRGVRNENGHTEFTPGLQWQIRKELKLVTDQELADAQRGKLPDDIEREKGGEE